VTNDEIIKEGLTELRKRQVGYRKYQRYYDGNHDLAYSTKKFLTVFGELFKTFSDNLIPTAVNGIADNLQVQNFTVQTGESSLSEKALEIWEANFMEQRSNELHREVLLKGDAYAIVWLDENGKAVIYPNKADNCIVGYDSENPGKRLWAIKTWKEGKKTRLNLFLPDEVIKYESGFHGINGTKFNKIDSIENTFGSVPVFHFTNQASVGEAGTSEVEPLIPLNDALNKMVLDMLVASEFGAFRQRWATGIEITYGTDGKPINPFTAGAEGIWATTAKDAKFGDFQVTDLEQFIRVQESFRAEIARVASIPLHYLMLQSGNFASGRALQTAEKRFTIKMKMLQLAFGAMWAKVMCSALEMCGCDKGVRLFTQWDDVTSVSENETLSNLRLKHEGLEIPLQQIWKEAGYGAEDIRVMLEQRKSEGLSDLPKATFPDNHETETETEIETETENA
jgi:hypothetical protein